MNIPKIFYEMPSYNNYIYDFTTNSLTHCIDSDLNYVLHIYEYKNDSAPSESTSIRFKLSDAQEIELKLDPNTINNLVCQIMNKCLSQRIISPMSNFDVDVVNNSISSGIKYLFRKDPYPINILSLTFSV